MRHIRPLSYCFTVTIAVLCILLVLAACQNPTTGSRTGGGAIADDDTTDEEIPTIPFPVARTGQTESYAVNDDGDLRVGVEFPDPRFTDNGDGTVKDNATGLIWAKNMQIFGEQVFWKEGLDKIADLAAGEFGLTDGSEAGDWRMPNRNELRSLVDESQKWTVLPGEHPFTNATAFFWTSTTTPKNTDYALQVDLWRGDVQRRIKTSENDSDKRWAWPVRGESSNEYPVRIPKTGAGPITDYELHPGEDGSIQAGISWPEPRLVDNEDGTFTDLGTGLVWLKSYNIGSVPWDDMFDIATAVADGEYGLTDGSQPGDWRVANIKELESLVDMGNYSTSGNQLPYFLRNDIGFNLTLSGTLFWSSSINSDDQFNKDRARIHFFFSAQLYGAARFDSEGEPNSRIFWVVRDPITK